MPSPREYLDSIIAIAAKLQKLSDDKLENIVDELKEIDDSLDSVCDYLESSFG